MQTGPPTSSLLIARFLMEHPHDDYASIRSRILSEPKHVYLRDFVYGAIDGAVTTFAVVSGVAGAGLDSKIVIVLGFANLIGDGFSMAASNYVSVRTENQLLDKARRMEERHIHEFPDGERDEVRAIYEAKGFEGADLDRAVEIITDDKERWVNTMLVDELGLNLAPPSPLKSAAATFVAFCVMGLLPLLSYVYGLFAPADPQQLFLLSTMLTAVAFFTIGALKSRFVEQKWGWSGLETLLIGCSAAGLAYLIGYLLSNLGAAT